MCQDLDPLLVVVNSELANISAFTSPEPDVLPEIEEPHLEEPDMEP